MQYVESENRDPSPISEKSALNLLADRCGIEGFYVDARGARQTASPETRQALLAAMGFDASTEDAARATLDGLIHEEWMDVAPHVQVQLQRGLTSVPVTYPATTEVVAWRLTLEGGKQHAGQVPFQSLELLDHTSVGGEACERRALVLDSDMPLGYHTLLLEPGDHEMLLVISPGTCWLPHALAQGRQLWGISAQLYLLASSRNWGIGDFSDLENLGQMLSRCGADAIGLNPLHAMFPDDPEHASPYSPASRLLLNVLYIDVAASAAEACCEAALQTIQSDSFQRELRTARESPLLNYSRVTGLKLSLLRQVFDSVYGQSDSSARKAFEEYRLAAAAPFKRHCLYLALRQHFVSQSPPKSNWTDWPKDYRDPDSSAVQAFARTHQVEVDFQAWLQFQADSQLHKASGAAGAMAVGLYRDLAVGADLSGAETWSNPRAVISGVHVGAPPDIYNPAGQDWGLPPFNPIALKKEGYRSFVDLVRANMRHAGGLRIDHVMGLQQLYWVPTGATAAQGAYVRYPIEDLIGILALESHRNRCLVVGEDLGTVPEGFRERMLEANILSYRVLFFEKNENTFIAPDEYPPLSLAVAGSHDLPPLIAWLRGEDLALKQKLGLFPNTQLFDDALSARSSDRSALLSTLEKLGFISCTDPQERAFADAAHRYLACSSSSLAMLQLDDITEEATPVNVPATTVEHPNWRRRLTMTLEEIEKDPHFGMLVRMLNRIRAPGGKVPGNLP